MPNILSRIERAEKALKSQGRFSLDCICFPENEPVFFGFEIEQQIAMQVDCPIHGNRFKTALFFLYAPKWRREKEPQRRARLSAQYQKAYLASFPPDLWPAEEEEGPGGTIFLRLKDGTKLLAYEPDWKASSR